MKKTGLILSSLLVIPFLSGCSSLVMPIYPDAEKYWVGNKNYEENVKSIDIDWLAGGIGVYEDESVQGVEVSEADETNLKDKEKVHTYLNDEGKLFIKYFESGYFAGFFNTSKYKEAKALTVRYNPELAESLKINMTSGNAFVYAKETENVSINITSGDLNSDYLYCENLSLNTTSGGLYIKDAKANNVSINVTSGNTSIDKLEASKISIDTTSGDVSLPVTTTDTIDVDCTSGKLTLGFASNVSNGKVHFTSGSLDLTLPESGGTAKITKTSGSIKILREHTVDGSLYKFGDGPSYFDISFTSGGVTVR